jgi:hypothetical protein
MITEDKWVHYIVGVCPGELGQPVAVAVAEQVIKLGHRRATDCVEVKWLEQVPAGTDLQTVADHLVGHLSSLDQTERGDGGVVLVLDVSRSGKKLYELLLKAQRVPRMVEITSGTREGVADGAEMLPRRELTAGLSVAFNAGKLKIAEAQELAQRFKQAMAAFQTRPVRSPDPFEAARTEADDGLVLAVGLCAWLAGREVPGLRGTGPSAERSGIGDYDPWAGWRD